MDNYLNIHHFAELTGTSTDTIKYYDRINLFKPAYVDPNNGYRYYSLSQSYKLSLIKYLRKLDMSIPDIAKYLSKQDINLSIDMIKDRLTSTEKELRNLTFQKEMLELRLSYLRLGLIARSQLDTITLNRLPERHGFSLGRTLVGRNDICYACLEIEKAFSNDISAFFLYQLGFIIPKDDLINGRYVNNSIIFIFCEQEYISPTSNYMFDVPSGYFVCGYHLGTFEKRGSLLKKMSDYIEAKGYRIRGDALQIKLADEDETLDEKDFLYQIQIPVELS